MKKITTQFRQTILALAVPAWLCCTANLAGAATIGTPSYVAGSNPTDLSAVGTLDWKIYGKQGGPTQTPSQSKSGGTSITMLAPVIGTPLSIADNTLNNRSSATFSWTGGTPTFSGSGVDPYDNGFSHTNAAAASYYATYETLTFVPGDTNQHTVHLYGYLTGNNSGISLQFSNSVAGTSPVLYTNAGTALTTAGFDYSVQFQADNPSDALTVVFTYQKTGGTATAKRMGINAAAIDAYVAPMLNWQGNVNSNWDIATTANWTNSSGAATNYTETGGVGDTTVTFDDTAINYFVNVTTAVHPLAILVNNSVNNYVISNAPGAYLGGPGTLTKQGTGTLTLVGTGNSFSNGVALSGGTLQLGANESIPDGAGIGNLTMGTNATLDLNGHNETINGLSNPTGGGTIDNVAGGGSSTLTVGNNNAASTFSGVIQNSSGTVALVKTGSGSLTLSGTNTFAGGVTLNAGQLNINSPGALGTGPLTIAASGVQLNNTSGAVVTLTTTNAQYWNGDFTFVGTRNLNFGPGAVTMNASRTVTVNGNSLAVGGPVAGSGFGLTKNGAGTLQINYSNTFNGSIVVNAGGLQLSTAHQGGGSVTLAGNASLQVNSAAPGATYSPGATLNVSSLAFGTSSGNTNLLTCNFGTNGNPATALITVAGALTAPNRVTVNILGTALTVGQFPLIHYGVSGDISSFQLGTLPYPSYVATLVDNSTNHSVDLNITAAGGPPKIWVGSVNSNWNISGTTNWLDSILLVPAVYTETISVGDSVQFDDTASNATVTVVAPVKPYSVTVNCSNLNYTIGGAAITGSASFTKQGSAALTLTTANTFTNSFNLQGGTLYLGANGAMGAGLVNWTGGTLSSDGATARTITNALAIAANSTFGDGGVGTGSLNFSGPAVLGGYNQYIFTANVPVTFSAGFTNGGFWKAGASSITLQSGTYPFAKFIQVLNGTLTLNGATVNNQDEIRVVANQTNGTSRLVVNGGSLTGGMLRLGYSDFGNTTAGGLASMATNIVDIAGLLDVGNNTVIMGRSAAWCELNLLTNGVLRVKQIGGSDISGNFTPHAFNFNGGVLRAATNNTSFLQGLQNAYVQAGGAIFDTTNFNITVNQPLLAPLSGPSGGLTKLGTGILTLGGASTYTNSTTVSNGTLLVNSPGSLNGSSTVTVAANAVLGGTGTINGASTLNAEAVLSPGVGGIGALTFSGDLTLNTASTNSFVVTTAGGVSNKVVVAGQLSPNNSVVSITSGTSLAVGTYPNLFSYVTTNGSSFNPTPVFDVAPAGVASIVDDGAGHFNLVVSPAPLSSTNAYLTSLVLTPAGALSPAFTTNGFNYMATNAFADTPTVTVTNADPTATNILFLNGALVQALTNGVPSAALTLGVGSTNSVQVLVTAQDGVTTNLYTVNVTRLAAPFSTNAYLTSLVLTPAGTLSPSFVSNTISYTATETNYGGTFTVTATSMDVNATNRLIINGSNQQVLTNGIASAAQSLNLNPGMLNSVQVLVTAQDGVNTNLYTVSVTQLPSRSPKPYLTNSVSGGANLVLNWPLANLGYRLLMQTNHLTNGVSSNTNDWGTVLGSAATNTASIAITKTNKNSYYRLVYP